MGRRLIFSIPNTVPGTSGDNWVKFQGRYVWSRALNDKVGFGWTEKRVRGHSVVQGIGEIV